MNIYPSLLDKSNEEKQLDDNQLAGFPVQILFRFAYFCHTFSVNSVQNYPQFAVLDNKSLIRCFVV